MILGVDGSRETQRAVTQAYVGVGMENLLEEMTWTVEGAVDGCRRPALFWHAGFDRKTCAEKLKQKT